MAERNSSRAKLILVGCSIIFFGGIVCLEARSLWPAGDPQNTIDWDEIPSYVNIKFGAQHSVSRAKTLKRMSLGDQQAFDNFVVTRTCDGWLVGGRLFQDHWRAVEFL